MSTNLYSPSFERVFIHGLAALDLGAGDEQPLIFNNCKRVRATSDAR